MELLKAIVVVQLKQFSYIPELCCLVLQTRGSNLHSEAANQEKCYTSCRGDVTEEHHQQANHKYVKWYTLGDSKLFIAEIATIVHVFPKKLISHMYQNNKA